jgi:uncharacterized damage-inducible protein DinB
MISRSRSVSEGEAMQPEHATVIARHLLDVFEYEIGTTTNVFAAVPADKLTYTPHGSCKTAIGLLRHITLEDEWLLSGVRDGAFAPMPDDSDACGIMTPQDAVARYKERIPKVLAELKALPAEAFTRDVDFFGNKMPAFAILSIVVRHSTHHRGQLTTYLRPMGGKVPSIYGPTADTVVATA